MTELSEIRRKADAGRFKRHRSRISMIDIDEVKQIESEKAQKAEERKKQKVASKEKPVVGAGQAADKNGTQDEADANGDDGHDGSSQNAPRSAPEAYSQQDEDDDDHEDSHHRVHHQDDEDEHDDHHGGAMHHHHHHGAGSDEEQRSDYIPDGTQALLNAAFHSTKDIMTEVVSQQQSLHNQQHHHQYQQQHHYEQEEQQHYHRGFEPEDANQHLPYAYGGFNSSYAPQFADPSHAHQQQQLHQPQYHHQLQPPQHQYQQHQVQHQYGFLDDQQQQQQQPAPSRLPGFDGVQHNVNQGGSYMDGPEYWR